MVYIKDKKASFFQKRSERKKLIMVIL